MNMNKMLLVVIVHVVWTQCSSLNFVLRLKKTRYFCGDLLFEDHNCHLFKINDGY